MPLLNVDGAEVYYETWLATKPAGQWVTLINGHTRTLQDFKTFGSYLNKKGYSVLAFDNRGSGKTVTHRKFSIADVALDVRALWRELDCRGTHVVGFSLGGAVALWLAAEDPAPMLSLTTVSSSYQWKAELPDATAPEFSKNLERYFSASFFKAQQPFILHFGKELAKRAGSGDVRQGAAWQREAIEGLDLKLKLAKIALPSLIIHGDEDKVIPLAEAQQLHKLVGGSELSLLSGVGHLPLVECAQALFDKIADFISRVNNNLN